MLHCLIFHVSAPSPAFTTWEAMKKHLHKKNCHHFSFLCTYFHPSFTFDDVLFFTPTTQHLNIAPYTRILFPSGNVRKKNKHYHSIKTTMISMEPQKRALEKKKKNVLRHRCTNRKSEGCWNGPFSKTLLNNFPQFVNIFFPNVIIMIKKEKH